MRAPGSPVRQPKGCTPTNPCAGSTVYIALVIVRLVALLLVARSTSVVAETLPLVRVGGGYVPDHGGTEVTAAVGGLIARERLIVAGDLAFDYRGSDGKVLSLGVGIALPVSDGVALLAAPKFLVGSVDDASARGVRGSVFVTFAAFLYAEVGYDYLWKAPTSEGSLRFSAGLNVALPWWIPEAALR